MVSVADSDAHGRSLLVHVGHVAEGEGPVAEHLDLHVDV